MSQQATEKEKSKPPEKQPRKISNPSTPNSSPRLDTVNLPVSMDLTGTSPPNTTRINSVKTSSLNAEMNSNFPFGYGLPFSIPEPVKKERKYFPVTPPNRPNRPIVESKSSEDRFVKILEHDEIAGLPPVLPNNKNRIKKDSTPRPITVNYNDTGWNPFAPRASDVFEDKKEKIVIEKNQKNEIDPTMDFETQIDDSEGIHPTQIPFAKKTIKKVNIPDSKDAMMDDVLNLSDTNIFLEGSEARDILCNEDGSLQVNEKQLFFIQLPSQLPLKLQDPRPTIQRKLSDGNIQTSVTGITSTTPVASTSTTTTATTTTPAAGTSKVDPKKKAELSLGNTDTAPDNINAVDFVSNLPQVPSGYLGEMLIYKSGKIKLKLGEILLDVQPGVQNECMQQAVAVSKDAQKCFILGPVPKRIVCIPDVEYFLNNEQNNTSIT